MTAHQTGAGSRLFALSPELGMRMRLQAAGKDTVGEALAKDMNCTYLSYQNVLKEEVKEGTPTGIRLAEMIKQGARSLRVAYSRSYPPSCPVAPKPATAFLAMPSSSKHPLGER